MAWEAWVRAIHVLGAAIWFGGAVFAILFVLPVVRAAGPAGKAFMLANLKRGGWGLFFGPVGGITMLAGIGLYIGLDYHKDPFATTGTLLLTVGATIGLLAWAEGLAVNMPMEVKMKKIAAGIGPGGPTPEQAAALEKMGMKMGKGAIRSVLMLSVTILLMLARRLVT